MNITSIKLFLLTSILVSGLTGSLTAVRDEGFTRILSEDTHNQLVWDMVKESEDYARNQDYKRAAESLKQVINLASTNENIHAELDEEISEGPLLLHIIGTRAHYLLKASKDTDYAVVTECTEALSNYAGRAEGKGWGAYKHLYKARGFCFAEKYNYEDREQNIVDMFFYDPTDVNAYFSNFDWKRRPTNEVRKVLDAYYTHGGKADQQTRLMEASWKIRTGNNALTYACDLLENNPNTILTELRALFEVVGPVLTNQPQEKLQAYYDSLTNFAVRKKPGRENIQIVGFIIDERNKVQSIQNQKCKNVDINN